MVSRFRSPPVALQILILLGMAQVAALGFYDYTPLPLLRTIAYTLFRSQDNTRVVFWLALAIHIGEAAYACNVCFRRRLSPSLTFKWTFQTALYGYASLGLLL
eukprot:TRINITY_DN10685_c0_g1_i1.p1 TRINITY_DN10685_c0_g1~~TRINITY_DN10685_c0_g1_i1.p1  ORF type:complete len:121 (-),score=28.38 TRINITY_DN10685_c0_g1_i1:3-311(-)